MCTYATIHNFPVFFLLTPRPPRSTLFPYTTLFRSESTRGIPEHCTESARERLVRFVTGLKRDVGNRAIGRFQDRKSTRLNSSHVSISYAVFCLKKKKTTSNIQHMNNTNVHTTKD